MPDPLSDYRLLGVAPYKVAVVSFRGDHPTERAIAASVGLVLDAEAPFRRSDRTLVLAGGQETRVEPPNAGEAMERARAVFRARGAEEIVEGSLPEQETLEDLLFHLGEYDQIVNVGWLSGNAEKSFRGATWGLHASLTALLETPHKVVPIELCQSVPPIVNLLFSDLPLVLVSRDNLAIDTVAAAIHGSPVSDDPLLAAARRMDLPQTHLENIALYGVPLEASTRPFPATVAEEGGDRQGHHVLFRDACTKCGECERLCPVEAISETLSLLTISVERCIGCQVCVEACPEDCLLPDAEAAKGVMVPNLGGLGEWLGTMSGKAARRAAGTTATRGVALPSRSEGLTVLGLSILTQMEHAAALLVDGRIVGSVAEERFCRVKHYGWRRPGALGTTLGNDLSLSLEQAFCWRSIHALLEQAGLTLDDIDIFAINGIPARHRRSYSPLEAGRPPRILRSGRFIFVPHHLAHASSAFRVSGSDEACVFTVDGSGDRETAALFRASSNGELEQVFDVPTAGHCSIGGVYETVTQILGFGEWGQGSTMALAGSGEATFDMSSILSAASRSELCADYDLAYETFRHLARDRRADLTQDHRNLAASVQQALEETVLALVRDGLETTGASNLCLAGGVSLNCSMNARLYQELGLAGMFVQPAANDAGTALGAALEAHRSVTGDNPNCGEMEHADLGPAFDDAQIEQTLKRFGVPYRCATDLPREVAQRVAEGEVICWFQGPMEHGPRALGRRSIVADPRSPRVKVRLNQMKGREPWRPFGPSILSGREKRYFEEDFHSPFMLFTVSVLPERRAEIPAVLHVDGSTRPQSVRSDTNPEYHAMIEAFEQLTGVPMVVNTSFNTAFEPIVCTPADALASFAMLQADALAMGSFIVERIGSEV